jgi:hypothetical protein
MTPDVAVVERIPAGALITFEDRRSAIFSATILYQLLPNAQPVAPIETANTMNDPSVN